MKKSENSVYTPAVQGITYGTVTPLAMMTGL